MRDKKRTAKFAVFTFLSFLLLIAAGAFPVLADGNGYALVEDGAGLLSAADVQELQEQADELAERTGYDFFVVTTADARGKEARDYAEDYYMDHKTTLDGVVYLIDMDNREIYIAPSGDMRYYRDDERWNYILDDAYDYVADEAYAEAFAVMLSDTSDYLEDGIRENTYTVDEETGQIQYYQKPRTITLGDVALCLAAGLIAGGAVFGITIGKYKMKLGNYSYSYQENSQLKLNRQTDTLVNRVVTHRHIPQPPRDTPSSGGGHSSTVHTGSGGNSFGGGGRKF